MFASVQQECWPQK